MRPEVRYTSDSDLESIFSVEEPKACGKQPTANKYVCSFEGCGETFRRMVHLDRHEYKHTGIRKHVCFYEGCSKSYTIITHLKRHIKVFHEKIKESKVVECTFDFCKAKLASNHSLERHIREVHENPKIYNCSHCNERFTQRIKLRRHVVKHTGEYPFNCSKCSKGFVQEYFFNRHICKTYKCEKCQESFQNWSELLAHRKATNHKISYKCDKCPKEYISKYHLNEHKTTHEEDKEVYKCTYSDCPKFYPYKSNLLIHIRDFHEGTKLKCTYEGCDQTLSNKSTLKNHIKNVHMKVVKPKIQKVRAKRKDAGTRKQSTLSKLSGVIIDKKIDKMIMEGTVEVEIDLLTEEGVEDQIVTDSNEDEENEIVLTVAE